VEDHKKKVWMSVNLDIIYYFSLCDISNRLVETKSIWEVLNIYLDCQFIF